MESHILNTYHQARYGIPTRDRSSTSESYSSESSFNQNSPEYLAKYQRMTGYQKDDWSAATCKQNFPCESKMVSSDSSSEDDASDPPQVTEEEVVYETVTTEEVNDDYEYVVAASDDDYEVVVEENNENPPNEQIVSNEGEVIHIFSVNPDLDIDLSENEDDYCIPPDEITKNCQDYEDEEKYSRGTDDNLGINLDGPVVSHVDEYFIKQNKPDDSADILHIKEHHVVNDVDEYFIKPTKTQPASELPSNNDIPVIQTVPNVDEFFVTPKAKKENLMVEVPNVDDFFVKSNKPATKKVEPNKSPQEDALPRIESIKRFLLEGMPAIKQTKNVQRSCSLPHSPAHLPCSSLEESKTSLSFEDLLDLSLEKDKDFDLSNSKTDDITTSLTEEDVNSFLITDKVVKKCHETKNDFSLKLAVNHPGPSKVNSLPIIKMRTSNPLPAPPARSVLDFCIEKPIKDEPKPVKVDVDDFIDVESLNETVLPVLEATNVSSLLEQFEASEKLNNVKKPQEETPVKQNALSNGMRLQDAALQLSKNKMRQILISPNAAAAVKKPQTSHLDHDYCSPKKKSSIQVKGGQSLLKPEVLSSNTKILKSRHRSCKDKKVVYHLSSDDESDSKKAQNNKDPIKASVKESLTSNHRKKASPTHEFSYPNGGDKCNISVIPNNASKASDIRSQSTSGSIKLTIKNRSKVILKLDCDAKDSENYEKSSDSDIKLNNSSEQKSAYSDIKSDNSCEGQSVDSDQKVDGNIESISINDTQPNSVQKISVSEPKIEIKRERKAIPSAKKVDNHSNRINNAPQKAQETCKKVSTDSKHKSLDKKGLCEVDLNKDLNIKKIIKEEVHPNDDNFYTGLFKNKTNQITMPSPIINDTKPKIEKSSVRSTTDEDNKPQIKKLNLQEYKKRRDGLHAIGSAKTVSPEPIFPEMIVSIKEKIAKSFNTISIDPKESEPKKKVFDPIKEASRKIILGKNRKKNAEALRKREDDLVMSKIPKVENLQLQPLISDAEIMKMVGMAAELAHKPLEKPKTNNVYEELVLVSVGINTDEDILRQLVTDMEPDRRKLESPTNDKSLINFRIKKSDNILKQNVFDVSKDDCRSTSVEQEKEASPNRDTMDKERYKDITETLKSVGKQVDTKSSNSLFASIQQIVLKKAPEKERKQSSIHDERRSKSISTDKPEIKHKTVMVKDYDTKLDHGEDKVILHLERNRAKVETSCVAIQTEPTPDFGDLATPTKTATVQPSRKRTQSSVSKEPSPAYKDRAKDKSIERSAEKKQDSTKSTERLTSKERSRSKDRYTSKYRSRSRRSKSRRTRKSRSRSRSTDRYRRYNRSHSPYRRRRRSSSNSRRQPSRNDYAPRSRKDSRKSRSPTAKRFKPSPDKSAERSHTPPPRKPTISESSDTSTSTSSSSSSSSSSASSGRARSPRPASPYRPAGRPYRAYSQDRDDTPVEERRIVFVGRLESDITKASLRGLFCKFGPVVEVTLHTKEDGCRYGFVTFSRARDAWGAVEAAGSFPQYDVGFGGRRAFCRQRYADLDGLEAEYSELAYPLPATAPRARPLTFEQMLSDAMTQLGQRRAPLPPPPHDRP